jgi:hypothetical protein
VKHEEEERMKKIGEFLDSFSMKLFMSLCGKSSLTMRSTAYERVS